MNHTEPINDEDGLVHHMNFEVLDLENWKPNELHIPPRFMKTTSSLMETRPISFSRNKKKIQQTPNASPLNSSSSKDRLPPRVRRSNSYDLPPANEYHTVEQVHQMTTENETSSSSSSSSAAAAADVDSVNKLFDVPHLVNGGNWKKSNATSTTTNRSRSSPLRRFLDPLLKPKGAHLAEKVHKSKLDPRPSIATMNHNELLHIKKHRSSNNVHALLQLTLKNGIPFFKLAVERSSDILAAAVRKLPSGEEDDTSLIYAFYSVHEAKKKSGGWINIYQSLKEKGYIFEHNIVGQMRINSSYHAEFSGPEKGLYVVRESVLYSTDATHADQKTLDCMVEEELAAIIVKNSSDGSCGDIGSSKTTIVVLPDCVHIWPDSGSRSPLINRWRSGGSCDCGGWDIGCQFHVLLSCHQNEILNTSTTPSASNHLDLCYQVGHKNKCSFRLVSVTDGLYSLEYDPSMSLLQAFSICVAVVSSQKLTHIFEVNNVSHNEKVSSQVSKHPASPVARV